ncbi:MAG: ABC transporter ATP-binding protein [Candidatus Cloacimonetes bacterium]|nr:ABC transporter ATP-binding protein [Candidatus Cloacimonadota bacterium]
MFVLREMLISCLPYSRLYFLSFVCLFLTNAFMALIPLLVKEAIDRDVIAGLNGNFLYYPALILLVAVFLAAFRIASRILIYRACREQEHDLREKLMQKILSAKASVLNQATRGDLITNMLEDTTQVRLLVGFGFVQAGNILLLYGISLPFMLQISPILTLYCVAPYPILLIWVAYLNQRLYHLNLEVKQWQGELADFTTQSIHGIHVIHSHNSRESMAEEYKRRVDSHYQASWKAARLDIIMLPGMIFLASLGEWAVIRYGVPMIQSGLITRGDFLALHGYIGYLLFASISVGFGVSTFNRGYTSMQRLLNRYAMEEEKGQGEALGFNQVEYEFQSLEFCYPLQPKPALKVDHLKFSSLQTVGVFGPIGSGKSTFFRLLMGFFIPDQGKIFVNQEILGEKNLAQLRASVVYVSQELFLFSRSIRDNLDFYGNHSDEEIQDAIDFACLREDIEGFKDGLMTLVGERGVRLSTGQKQRIAIARAWLRKPALMILDDCFSALDTVVEEKILKNLMAQRGDGGLIISSHRISTLKHCQRILVFKGHTIEGDGTHTELMKKNEYYRTNYELQRDFV